MFGQGGNNGTGKKIRSGVMILVYLLMAYLIFFTSVFDKAFSYAPQLRTLMGFVFLFYGLFRAYRLWKTL